MFLPLFLADYFYITWQADICRNVTNGSFCGCHKLNQVVHVTDSYASGALAGEQIPPPHILKLNWGAFDVLFNERLVNRFIS